MNKLVFGIAMVLCIFTASFASAGIFTPYKQATMHQDEQVSSGCNQYVSHSQDICAVGQCISGQQKESASLDTCHATSCQSQWVDATGCLGASVSASQCASLKI